MIEALSPQAIATRDKRCLWEFALPEEMRDIVKGELLYEGNDLAILEKLKERFPDAERYPSPRTIQTWRLDARRERDEERLEVVSKVLWRSAQKAVPKAVASLYGALTNAYALMEEATEQGNVKVRLQAQRNVGDLGEKLLNQFRGGPAEGASAVSPELIEAAAVRQLIERGVCKDEAEAKAHFLLLSESVGKAMPAEGEAG